MQNSGNDLKKFSKRLTGLIFGLFLYALGIAFTIQANFGYAPWDVFHQGISNIAGISIGNASIVLGLVICVALYLLGEALVWEHCSTWSSLELSLTLYWNQN